MEKKYIKIPKDFFKPLKYKINWDWDSYFKIRRLAVLEDLFNKLKGFYQNL